MSDGQIGRLIPLETGYWGICYSQDKGEKKPDEIHSGDSLYLEVSGGDALLLTRIEYDHGKRNFYSVDGYPLKVGARAALAGMGF